MGPPPGVLPTGQGHRVRGAAQAVSRERHPLAEPAVGPPPGVQDAAEARHPGGFSTPPAGMSPSVCACRVVGHHPLPPDGSLSLSLSLTDH
jgi:hypothetical protein